MTVMTVMTVMRPGPELPPWLQHLLPHRWLLHTLQAGPDAGRVLTLGA